jgi:hypothetical protein
MTNTTKPNTLIHNTSFGPVSVTRSSRTMEIASLDWSVTLVWRSWGMKPREVFKTTRIYGALDAFVAGFSAEETRLQLAITDHTVKDPTLAKFQRDSIQAARPAVLDLLTQLGTVLDELGEQPTGFDKLGDVKFSTKAGCSMCPCSPGFVADERLAVRGPLHAPGGFDLWIN